MNHIDRLTLLSTMTYLRLEYNPTYGGFHIDSGIHDKNTNGWVTIVEGLSEAMIWDFLDYFECFYQDEPQRIETVKNEFKQWLKLRII